MAFVDRESMDYEMHVLPFDSYGLTSDTEGRIWVVSAALDKTARYDPETEQWDVLDGAGHYGGATVSADGIVWVANYVSGIGGYDAETMELVYPVFNPAGDTGQVKGLSVDVDGYLWVIRRDSDKAVRLDPDNNFAAEVVSGFNKAYTYSDMTGGILFNNVCNPPQ
jgi:sugar lactone lactonase YvrE